MSYDNDNDGWPIWVWVIIIWALVMATSYGTPEDVEVEQRAILIESFHLGYQQGALDVQNNDLCSFSEEQKYCRIKHFTEWVESGYEIEYNKDNCK